MRRLAKVLLLGAAVFSFGDLPVQATERFQETWFTGRDSSDQRPFAAWCLKAAEHNNRFLCEALECVDGQPHYGVLLRYDAQRTGEPRLKVQVDGGSLFRATLRKVSHDERTERWLSDRPVQLSFVWALAAGNAATSERFGESVTNTLGGSAKAIRWLAQACGFELRPPAGSVAAVAQETAPASPHNGQLAQLCAPYAGQVRQQGVRNIPGMDYTIGYLWNQRPARDAFDTGVVSFDLRPGQNVVTVKVYYRSHIGQLGLVFQVPNRPGARLSSAQRREIAKLHAMIEKFFEWRAVAKANGVTDFRKAMPAELTPKLHVHKNFTFSVFRNNQGALTYSVQSVREHGLCWLYEQSLSLEQILTRGLTALAAGAAQQRQQRNQRQQLNDQFN